MPKGDKAYLRVIDYTGRAFGRLTVLTQAPSREGRTMWFCRSNHVVIEVDGESLCVAEWSRRLGISAFTLYARLQRGWVGAQVLGPKQRQGKNLNPKETIND